ncbi:Transcriptional regulator [Paramarasmius palmivorus]|uniref:Transcriptional regulator n=1 Tax=Paramarasmius palmivorus TaxID=297713 RepID=A0AAW0CQT7_9AGAR
MLQNFTPVPALRSSLLTQPLNKDQIPPTEDLESLLSELKALKQRSTDRAKKAEADVKTLEESYRRMKERERDKGKGRERLDDSRIREREREKERNRERRGSSVSVMTDGGSSTRRAGSSVSGLGERVEKIKKERDCEIDILLIHFLEAHQLEDTPDSTSAIRQRLAHSGSSGPSSVKGSVDPRGSEDKKKKKKRKRDEGSDGEIESPLAKGLKPSLSNASINSISNSHSSSSHMHKTSIGSNKAHTGSGLVGGASGTPFKVVGPDFTLPSTLSTPLLPTRPQPAPIQLHYTASLASTASTSTDPSTSTEQQPSTSTAPPSQISEPSTSTFPPRHPQLPDNPPTLHGQVSSHPAHPLHSLDVHDDFSKLKVPGQVLVNTFYTSVEPWIRNVKEEDVGFLEWEDDVVEPFVMPKLGRWYESVWEELDSGVVQAGADGKGAEEKNVDSHNTSFAAPEPQWDPSTLKEEDLVHEGRGHGPLTERLISALMPIEGAMNSWKGVKAAEDAMEGRPGGSGAAASKRERVVSVADLETRIRDTMRAYGLLGPRAPNGEGNGEQVVVADANGMPDYTDKVDDPIATALRHAQAELRVVSATNRARRLRLAAIARDRLAYQEYLDLRDSIDKNINLCYAKLQKRDSGTTKNKKKSKKDKDKERGDSVALNGVSASTSGTPAPGANGDPDSQPPPCPAALGLGPDPDTNELMVTEQLKQLVETRRQWVDTVGGVFDAKERENPGRIWGIPQKSIYEGLEDEVEEILKERMGLISSSGKEADGVNGHVNGVAQMEGIIEGGPSKQHRTFGSKGKGRLPRSDDMDIG